MKRLRLLKKFVICFVSVILLTCSFYSPIKVNAEVIYDGIDWTDYSLEKNWTLSRDLNTNQYFSYGILYSNLVGVKYNTNYCGVNYDVTKTYRVIVTFRGSDSLGTFETRPIFSEIEAYNPANTWQDSMQSYWYNSDVRIELYSKPKNNKPTIETNYTEPATTYTFNSTNSIQNWTVPEGVSKIRINAWGGKGGNGSSMSPLSGGLGGNGGYSSGAFPINSGDVLKVYVGNSGQNGVAYQTFAYGGWPNGSSGESSPGTAGAGGGGSSYVLKDTLILVEGSGGGGGGSSGGAGFGSNGGNGGGYYGGYRGNGGGYGGPGSKGLPGKGYVHPNSEIETAKEGISNSAGKVVITALNMSSPSITYNSLNSIKLSVAYKDIDIGNTVTVYYRIDGSYGQIGQSLGSFSSTGIVQNLSQNIDISSLTGRMHNVYVWAVDNLGGKSREIAIPLINSRPSIVSTSPVSDSMYCETDTTFTPQITISNSEYDTLTCMYYIDTETTARDTKSIAFSTMSQTINLKSLDMRTLNDGIHTIKFVVSDNKDSSTETTNVSFKVDKTLPILGEISVSSQETSVTVSGSAIDTTAGLHSTMPYKQQIGESETSWTSSIEFTKYDLNPNTQYKAIFTARDAINHEASKQYLIYTKAKIPELAVTNETSFTLELNSIDQNPTTTKYLISVGNGFDNVIRYVTPEGTLTESPVWTAFNNKKITIKELRPYTVYRFKAKARNEEGFVTNEGSLYNGTTLIAPPGSPNNEKITARATNNSITLTWDPIEGASSYEVEINGVTIKDNGLFTAYTHSNLGPNTQFTFRIRAVNKGGNGIWSNTITHSTLSNAPPIPLNINAAANKSSIILTWDPSPGATTYQINVDGTAENINVGSSTNYVHTGLTSGTTHIYKVRSMNTLESPWSDEIKVTTLADAPIIPANISAVPGKNQIILSWDGIVGETYEIEVDRRSTLNIGSTPSYVHNNLIPNTQYTYRVRSNRDGVLSDWSTIFAISTSADVFGTPYNFKANASDNMVELTWDVVTEATGYELDVDGNVMSYDAITGCIHMGLVPGSQHVYRIRAQKVEQFSDWSSPISVTTFLLSTPEDFSATTSQTAITLNWTAVDRANGYDVEMDGIMIENVTNTTYTYNGLEVGSQHVFKVRARNQDGFSAWSLNLTKSTQLSSFEKPVLTAVARKNSVSLMWNEIDGIESYDVEVDGVVVQNITNRYYIHTGLAPGATYIYKVKAISQELHDWSDELSVKTLSESPEIPMNIEASATINRILITWDNVVNATEYAIEVDGQVINVGSGTSYLHTSLIPDTQYTYRIKSINPVESSAWSTPITLKTKKSTQSYLLDCADAETFNIIFTASNLQNPSLYTYTVTYDENELEVVDLCASTARIDYSSGNVIGADVRIVQYSHDSPGTIVFRKNNTGIAGQSWSGTVNSIKFRSKITGLTTVQYTVN